MKKLVLAVKTQLTAHLPEQTPLSTERAQEGSSAKAAVNGDSISRGRALFEAVCFQKLVSVNTSPTGLTGAHPGVVKSSLLEERSDSLFAVVVVTQRPACGQRPLGPRGHAVLAVLRSLLEPNSGARDGRRLRTRRRQHRAARRCPAPATFLPAPAARPPAPD